ncbi:MAG: endonuclease III domain-containing protein [Terriglobales bacterium]
MKPSRKEEQLRAYYHTLHARLGRQHWWPARTRFEVIVGAYLTQNTSWTNVEIALRRLRADRVLTLAGIRNTPSQELEELIRSSGYFRQKAARLKTFVAFVDGRHNGSLARMFSQPTETLRQQLLQLNGVGPETADSILLYAGQHPAFVVDAYTRRILERHRIVPAQSSYEEIRTLFERALSQFIEHPMDVQNEGLRPSSRGVPSENGFRTRRPANSIRSYSNPPSAMSRAARTELVQVYNEMHGLIVSVGKQYCLKSRAICEACPLQQFLPHTGVWRFRKHP